MEKSLHGIGSQRLIKRSADVDTYWEAKRAELPKTPALYGFQKNTSTTRSERITLSLGRERSEKLRALTREPDLRCWTTDLSLFNIFATALFVYLYRVSGQSALAIGCPAHNRPTASFKETPGLFIEIFPLLAKIEQHDTFIDLLQRVRCDTNEFLRYAQAGAGSVELTRGFNVILNYIHAAFGNFAGAPVHSEWVHPGHCDPRHHLRLQVHDFDSTGTIQLQFDANCEVFDEAMRQRIPYHFLRVLDAIITDRTQPVLMSPIVSETEFHQLQFRLSENTTIGTPVESVLQLFYDQVESNPVMPALRFRNEVLTYRELDQKANRLARFLLEKGSGPDQRIGIFLKRSPELILSILAIWKTGATYVPIPTDYPSERIQHILQDARVTLLITQGDLSGTIEFAGVASISLAHEESRINSYPDSPHDLAWDIESAAYLMYTSGSTGKPKGVIINHSSLVNYISWAASYYFIPEFASMPLFTSIGFDLTVTSMFLPLITGGTIVIYEEDSTGPDLSLLRVLDDNAVDVIKLTPSHLALLKDRDLSGLRITTMIVGGEDLKRTVAEEISQSHGNGLRIYNEYGPTEATVGCIVHDFNANLDRGTSVPIGQPISGMQAFVLDGFGNPVPEGVTGELYVTGVGLAAGYCNQETLTREKFVVNPFQEGSLMYRTGDLARINSRGELECLGRIDHQMKIGGIRIEPGEIESAVAAYPQIRDCVVTLQQRNTVPRENHEEKCTRCGLTSRYPKVEFDELGVCNLCRGYEKYQQEAQQYFKSMDDLREVFTRAGSPAERPYDCLALLSGGKDSTYALARLAEMDLKILAFTLDNGYISEGAKNNIRKVVDALRVDHMFGTTPAMNAIFVDSLQRHHNVCDGCFKTIYTLSTQVALEKKIPFIVTGLSRGQFFETRLTEELFRSPQIDGNAIDRTILDARKAYHRVDDAVYRHLDVSMFEEEDVFNKVQFIDFYRYCDVSLDEMLAYLDRRLPWVRPSDTGRSTNCLINKAGIYVHKKAKGYSNYAYPYSWDVRVGHKKRDAALAEIEEEIEEKEVRQILDEIGYHDGNDSNDGQEQLTAYYVSDVEIPLESLVVHLSRHLPHYMIPSKFIRMQSLPRTPNAKIDRQALALIEVQKANEVRSYEAPRNEIETIIAELWSTVLYVDRVGVNDNFLALGGYSLAAIRLTTRINEAFDLQLPVNRIFEFPTIASLSEYIEQTISAMLEEHDRETDIG